VIVGLESRGYYFGVPLADKLGVPFVPLRKKGKLPGELESVTYGLEYKDQETIEIQKARLPPGSRVVITDDLLVGHPSS
jgi:adenine phosphoribosyltransferase